VISLKLVWVEVCLTSIARLEVLREGSQLVSWTSKQSSRTIELLTFFESRFCCFHGIFRRFDHIVGSELVKSSYDQFTGNSSDTVNLVTDNIIDNIYIEIEWAHQNGCFGSQHSPSCDRHFGGSFPSLPLSKGSTRSRVPNCGGRRAVE
jgi:hypothetical protein